MSRWRFGSKPLEYGRLSAWVLALFIGALIAFFGSQVMNSAQLKQTATAWTHITNSDGTEVGNLTLKLSSLGQIAELEPINASVDLNWFDSSSTNSTFLIEFQGAIEGPKAVYNETLQPQNAKVMLSNHSARVELVWIVSGDVGLTIQEMDQQRLLSTYTVAPFIRVESRETIDTMKMNSVKQGLQLMASGTMIVIGSSLLYGTSILLGRRFGTDQPESTPDSHETLFKKMRHRKEILVKILCLPPSFFALLSGSILGMAIGFAQNLSSSISGPVNLLVGGFAIIFSLCSMVSFSYVSISLEVLRDSLRETPERDRHLEDRLRDKRVMLGSSLLAGIVLAVMSILFEFVLR
jgi:hypothetical protein